ncbi:MAG: hypothetical protein ACRD2W_12305 [Acidimicrobiales bacterium]
MADHNSHEPVPDVPSVADWIADVVIADRADASSATPPAQVAVSPHSLLHRVVVAEGGSPD